MAGDNGNDDTLIRDLQPKTSGLCILLVFLALVGLILACASEPDAVPTPTPAPTATPSPAVPATPTERVYTNGRYSYQVTVPPGWQIDDKNPKGVTLKSSERRSFITIAVYSQDDLPLATLTLEGYRDAWLALMRRAMPQFNVITQQEVRVGKEGGILYTYTWVDRGVKLRAQALLAYARRYSYEAFGWVPEEQWLAFAEVLDRVTKSFTLRY